MASVRDHEALPLAARNLRACLGLLQALMDGGLAALVIAPGSRSAPLAQAAALLEARGLRLLTAIDERSAAFWALGFSRASGRLAAVATTSGTAVANLLPAAVEADWGTVPLLLISADRPQRLKGCGANQTVNQEQFLGASCRWTGEGDPAGLAAMPTSALQALAAQALQASSGAGGKPPGPVHLNLPFDEPLHSDASAWQALQQQPPPAASKPGHTSGHSNGIANGTSQPYPSLDPDQSGVVVAGPWRGHPGQWAAHRDALSRWLQRSGWPLLADGLSGLRGQPGLQALAGYDLLLQQGPTQLQTTQLQATQVLRLGPLPASRRLQQWLSRNGGQQLVISEAEPRPLDPLGSAQHQYSGGLANWCAAQPAALWQGQASQASLELQQRWRQADQALQQLLDDALKPQGPLNEPALARALSRRLPAGVPVVLANSSPVRDWESFAASDAPPRPLLGFRGASGIDGTLSSACGIAEALGQAVLLSGDLALLHDSNGWLWRQQLRGRLAVVLINNGGGVIFEQLPIRHSGRTPTAGVAMDFERLFAMPQSVDTGLLCAAHGVPHRMLQDWNGLDGALTWLLQQPLAVLEVHTDRQADAGRRQRLRTMAQELVAEP
ncbi:MAG: 2-succinyl-5-enolpyruvyl-6-hydroxy-3-cyclohexene-1-carboxylic-acid synthase [Cyanobacteriota bacterium]|nr:2-succinyl-5-enolpyruvyl-6-hydroxy-3-cyclohexene-1-carboxylic-acid synthase [Cyanobacteriota bacterium]